MSGIAAAPFVLSHHLVIAAAIGVIAPFTGFAWPFALLTGVVIGHDDRDRSAGIRVPLPARLIRLLAVTGGVLAMLIAGAVLGGLVAFLIVWLVVRSERMIVGTSQAERLTARLLLGICAVVGFVILGSILQANLSIEIGG